MTNEIHTDPQITEFVTKVMDMAPEAPIFPGTVVAKAPASRKRVASWIWAPLAAAAAVLVIAPIALRGGDGDETAGLPFGSEQVETDTQTPAASTDPILGDDPVLPVIDGERNVLSLTPVVVGPGGTIVIDFSGGRNSPRSDLFWMDRFDYDEQQWFSVWILWSDRSADGARSGATATTSVIVPPLDIVDEGSDTLLLPSELPLGTYRVCIGVTDGDCGVFEISDEQLGSSGPIDTPVDLVRDGVANPSFGMVVLEPSSLSVVLTPAEWLIGPDAVLVARSDGFIGPEEDLPNGFYLRENPEAAVVELDAGPDVLVVLVDAGDPALQRSLSLAEWASELGDRTADDLYPMFFHVIYDADGRLVELTQQYIP